MASAVIDSGLCACSHSVARSIGTWTLRQTDSSAGPSLRTASACDGFFHLDQQVIASFTTGSKIGFSIIPHFKFLQWAAPFVVTLPTYGVHLELPRHPFRLSARVTA